MVDAPVKGANSFTEGEAKSRIEKMGFGRRRPEEGDHRRVARSREKNGQRVDVAVDYQGNVIEGAGSTATTPRAARPAR